MGAQSKRDLGARQRISSDYWSATGKTDTTSSTTPTATTTSSDYSRRHMEPSGGRSSRLAGDCLAARFPSVMSSEHDYYLEADDALKPMLQQTQPMLALPAGPSPQPKPSDELERFNDYYYCDDYDDYAIPCDNFCRLERSQVELVQMIGEGQKGFVFLGKLQSRDGRQIIDVAIKTLKYETDQLIEKLMQEAAMMRQFEHPHIIKFIGVCPETPALIAMELAKFGELKQYLKANKSVICVSQLVLFTFQISTALSYLESKQFVHRDVAARNILVCSHSCVKLADFGLSRNLQPEPPGCQFISAPNPKQLAQLRLNQLEPASDLLVESDDKNGHYVSISHAKLPVRWLAPESLAFRRFISASDVWMFAVCAWEIFHFGQLRPWPNIHNNQVLLAIGAGQRLSRPSNCPARLYQLLLQCWSYAPAQRPKFRDIKQTLWSIYLHERAREHSLVEQIERLEQQQRQQQLAARHKQLEHEQQVRLLIRQQQASQPDFRPNASRFGWSQAPSKSLEPNLQSRDDSSSYGRNPLKQQRSHAAITDNCRRIPRPRVASPQHYDQPEVLLAKTPACNWQIRLEPQPRAELSDDEQANTIAGWPREPNTSRSYECLQPEAACWSPVRLESAFNAMRVSSPTRSTLNRRRRQQELEEASERKERQTDNEKQGANEKEKQKEEEQRSRLALHRRLLGHIRLSPSSRDSRSSLNSTRSNESNGPKMSPNPSLKSQPQIESVDQSLEILASLMSSKSDDERADRVCDLSPPVDKRNPRDKRLRPKSCEFKLQEQWKQIGREFAKRQANSSKQTKLSPAAQRTKASDWCRKDAEITRSRTAADLANRF